MKSSIDPIALMNTVDRHTNSRSLREHKEKHGYTYCIRKDFTTEEFYFWIRFTTYERSGSAFFDFDNNEFYTTRHPVKKSIIRGLLRMVIGLIGANIKCHQLNYLAQEAYSLLFSKQWSDVDYYGNREDGVYFTITIADLIKLVDSFNRLYHGPVIPLED